MYIIKKGNNGLREIQNNKALKLFIDVYTAVISLREIQNNKALKPLSA